MEGTVTQHFIHSERFHRLLYPHPSFNSIHEESQNLNLLNQDIHRPYGIQ